MNKNMTEKELKQKTTSELESLQDFMKNKAIELINDGLYGLAIGYIKRADDIDSILYCRENGWNI